jgi:hypothetical protein
MAALGNREGGIAQIRNSLAALEAKWAGVNRPYFLCLPAEAYLETEGTDSLRAVGEVLTAADEYEEREYEA